MVLWAKGVGRRAALAMENLGSWLLSSPSKFNCKQECVVKGIGGIRLLAWMAGEGRKSPLLSLQRCSSK